MTDIFDTTILCKHCNLKMQPSVVSRNGLELRAIKCPKCGDTIVHPADLNGMENFKDLKDKTFNVKLRIVGNSHAVSIPKEIIDFVENHHKAMRTQMDDMVKLCFKDFDTLSLRFGDEFDEDDDEESEEDEENEEKDVNESHKRLNNKREVYPNEKKRRY
jgi:hypothetical protein